MHKQWYTWASIQTIGSCVDTSLCLTAEISQAHIWCRAKKGKYYSFKKASSIEWFWWWLSRRHCHPSVCQFFFNQSKQRAGFIQLPHCWSQELSDARYHWWKYFFIRPHWHLWRKTLNKNPCMRAVCDGLSRDIQSYKTLQAASYKLKDQRKIKNAYWMS